MKYRWAKKVAEYLPVVLLGVFVGAGSVYVASESPMLLEVRLGEKETLFLVDSRSTPNLCVAMVSAS